MAVTALGIYRVVSVIAGTLIALACGTNVRIHPFYITSALQCEIIESNSL